MRHTVLVFYLGLAAFCIAGPADSYSQPAKKDAPAAKKTAADDGGLDFTKGDLAAQTIGPIKAEAEKPQVNIIQFRITPEFKAYELTERSFVNEVLGTATHRQLDKKFKKRTFRIELPDETRQ